MQERLMAAVQQQQQYGMGSNPAQPQNFVDPRGGVHNAGAKQQRPADFEEYHNQQSRREAVAAAQRGQLRRSPSPDPFQVQHQSASTAAGAKRANRLSFNGAFGDQLAEHAIARKASGGAESHPRPDFMEQGYRSHTRGQASISSVGSGQSVILSEERRELVSPQGPAILLSSPEDSFPISSSVTAPVISTAAPFAGSAVSDDDSAGSSGSQSPDLESAASSTTSLGSISSFKALNPGAASFTPLPPVVVQPARPSFSASAPTKLTVVLRQPKGPVKEEELGTRNFEGRRRKQALKTLKRRSFTPAA